MANHKATLKSIGTNEKSKLRNAAVKSKYKTFIKKLESVIATGDAVEARKQLSGTESVLMRAVARGVLKLNKGARLVSQLTKKVKTLES